MYNIRALKIVVVVLTIIVTHWLAYCAGASPVEPNSDANVGLIESTLKGLNDATGGLQSYQCEVEYIFRQPVLDSKAVRTGALYYARFGRDSRLRINFDTLTQDDGAQQKYAEQYIFDGQWLTHIDFQIKQVQKRQLAEANEPIDAFELAKRNFPLIGFDKTDDLKQQFEINVAGEPNRLIQLQLTVRPDSIYKNDYKSVEVWIDKEIMLPAKISAVSTEGDICEIKFVKPKVNEKIGEKVFEFTIPDDFGKPEIIPLGK